MRLVVLMVDDGRGPAGSAERKWKVCPAPAGACGFGRRKRVLTDGETCQCGSVYRLAKNQKGVAP